MDDDDNEGRDGVVCVLFVIAHYTHFNHCCGAMPHCHLVVEFRDSLSPGFVLTLCLYSTTLVLNVFLCFTFLSADSPAEQAPEFSDARSECQGLQDV